MLQENIGGIVFNDEESDNLAYEESDIISTEEIEGSAGWYGNTFLLNQKQCALYRLLCLSGHSKYMTMYYVQWSRNRGGRGGACAPPPNIIIGGHCPPSIF